MVTFVVVTRHGPVYPLSQEVWTEVSWLAGDVAIAGHVAVTIVLDITVDHLVQGTKCGDVGVGLLVYH